MTDERAGPSRPSASAGEPDELVVAIGFSDGTTTVLRGADALEYEALARGLGGDESPWRALRAARGEPGLSPSEPRPE